ncbi:MAG: hypothetical protein JWM33_500 [Caulobacteraceae bacterium]|nr:hypothetical protein [Caulobacteraceae bacterium]
MSYVAHLEPLQAAIYMAPLLALLVITILYFRGGPERARTRRRLRRMRDRRRQHTA